MIFIWLKIISTVQVYSIKMMMLSGWVLLIIHIKPKVCQIKHLRLNLKVSKSLWGSSYQVVVSISPSHSTHRDRRRVTLAAISRACGD